jgi:hypothetical protein
MPKRWKIASGGSWTWQYIDTDQRPPKVLAQSMETWERKAEVRAEIEEMRRNNDIEEEEGDD